MSLLQQNKSSVASRTAFDILTVESGEESEDEVLSEPEVPLPPVQCVELPSQLSHRKLKFHSCRDTPSKPSKASQRKAAKAARQEKKHQSRVPLSGGDTYERLSPAPTVPLTEPDARPVPSDRSSAGPHPIDVPEPLPPKVTANPLRDEAPPSALN